MPRKASPEACRAGSAATNRRKASPASSSETVSRTGSNRDGDAVGLQKRLKDEFRLSDRRGAGSTGTRLAAGKKNATGPKRRKTDAANDTRSVKPSTKRSNTVRKTRKKSAVGRAVHKPEPAKIQDAETQQTAVAFLSFMLDGTRRRQIAKTLLGLFLVVAAGWVPAMRLFQVSSVEAVVNARMVTLRTPIDGTIEFRRDVNVLDADLASGTLVATVVNSRIDRSRINELQKDLELATIEKTRLEARQTSLSDRRDNLARLAASHRKVRIEALKTRLEEIESQRSEIAAKLENAVQLRDRSKALLGKQVVAAGSHQETETRVAVFIAALDRVEAEMSRVALEYRTLLFGGFFGDHYNDRPRAAIEMEATEQNLQEVEAGLRAQVRKVSSLRELLQAEMANVNRREEASIALPVSGRIWEPLVADGEYVNRGQPLVRILDCMNAMVTTAVSEEVYNSLAVGGNATFILRESGEAFPAIVTQLSGVSSAPANLAILPSALEKEPYRATVRVPDIGRNGNCLLGKTGRVVFEQQ